MAKDTRVCSIEGCERPRKSRGWCQTHYTRWLKNGDPGPAEIRKRFKRDGSPCAVDGCERPVWATGLCNAHYQRKNLKGSTGDQPIRAIVPVRTCTFEGCDKPHDSIGLCIAHRWQKKNGLHLTPLRRQIGLVDRDAEGRKYCGACRKWFPTENFGISQKNADGLAHKCRRCTRDANLRSNFGISLADYEEMLETQGGRCAICRKPETTGRVLSVDHDHKCCTGKKKGCPNCIRALLCQRCNQGLGYFRDSPESLRAAADYLEIYMRRKEGIECP